MDAVESVGDFLTFVVLLIIDLLGVPAVKGALGEIIVAFDALAALSDAAFAIRTNNFCVSHGGSTQPEDFAVEELR